MKKHKKTAAVVLSGIFAVACAVTGLTGCNDTDNGYNDNPLRMRLLANELSLIFLGNDAFSWNVMSVTPEQSYGYKQESDPVWYSYSPTTQNDINDLRMAFAMIRSELNKIDESALSGTDAATYRSAEYVINSYNAYYGSKYAADFELIGGSYINAQGGYVADFASAVENYSFRTETDLENLLSITLSTKNAFETYLDYASDRVKAQYPLYDYTINAMQDYLDTVYAQQDNYYLYSYLDRKIDGAAFLDPVDKIRYKIGFEQALTDSFMRGVKTLSDGLEEYKGNVTAVNASYLTSYNEIGKAYYNWSFENKTGMKNVDKAVLFNDLLSKAAACELEQKYIVNGINALQSSNTQVYNDFNAYLNGEKFLLGLTEPEEILEYLKDVSENIVPDLETVPEIDFKDMDDTVAAISSAVAYYLHSPVDEKNSTEHITLNRHITDQNPSELLTLIAHEGYPGHLYAYVNAKENGTSLLSASFSCTAFAEGWAQYAELALLEHIASSADDDLAVKYYAEYRKNQTITDYINILLLDMQINYFGATVQSLGSDFGIPEDEARSMVESLMEDPAVYVPYGYGMYFMIQLHDTAKAALGDKYDEVDFNGKLLSEGMGPTLDRAQQITLDHIASKRA